MRTRDEDKRERITRLPKLCGADIELGNFVLGVKTSEGSGDLASEILLGEISGLPLGGRRVDSACECDLCKQRRALREQMNSATAGATGRLVQAGNPQDRGRKFLPENGGCAYIDLNHLELCIPEVLSAFDHVACWHAMLRIARRALESANAKAPDGVRLSVLVNNSDGLHNSYGSHLNFLIARKLWDEMFHRRLHCLLWLAAYQASSIIFTGQGKVGSENGAPDVDFQISQRADFFECLVGEQTTYRRPIVNSRDEPLCGSRVRGTDAACDMARLHVIFFDNTLAHVASLLKVGVMQIILAMLEAGRINLGLVLDDPLDAVTAWSQDPGLAATARLSSGAEVTAAELQLMFLEEARSFVESGECDQFVPRASEIFALWEDTLLKLRDRDYESLAPRLDWVLKYRVLSEVIERGGLEWTSPEVKHLDHAYSSLDEAHGLYWAYERGGVVERVVSDEQIDWFTRNPPGDTRAWTRAMLLTRAGAEAVEDADWDSVKVRFRGRDGRMQRRELVMDNPLAFTEEDASALFESAGSLEELMDRLGAGDPGGATSSVTAAAFGSALSYSPKGSGGARKESSASEGVLLAAAGEKQNER